MRKKSKSVIGLAGQQSARRRFMWRRVKLIGTIVVGLSASTPDVCKEGSWTGNRRSRVSAYCPLQANNRSSAKKTHFSLWSAMLCWVTANLFLAPMPRQPPAFSIPIEISTHTQASKQGRRMKARNPSEEDEVIARRDEKQAKFLFFWKRDYFHEEDQGDKW